MLCFFVQCFQIPILTNAYQRMRIYIKMLHFLILFWITYQINWPMKIYCELICVANNWYIEPDPYHVSYGLMHPYLLVFEPTITKFLFSYNLLSLMFNYFRLNEKVLFHTIFWPFKYLKSLYYLFYFCSTHLLSYLWIVSFAFSSYSSSLWLPRQQMNVICTSRFLFYDVIDFLLFLCF